MSITSTKSLAITIRMILHTQLLIDCFSKIICKFSFKTHQRNLNFSPYYRGIFFCYHKIKCKQGVKIFEKHPNKMEIFLCIVEGHFSRANFFV